jgi:hypothetical protein
VSPPPNRIGRPSFTGDGLSVDDHVGVRPAIVGHRDVRPCRAVVRNGKSGLRGEQIEARGRLLDHADGAPVAKLIRDKYGLWVPIIEAVYWVGRVVKRQPRQQPAFIEILDVETPHGSYLSSDRLVAVTPGDLSL